MENMDFFDSCCEYIIDNKSFILFEAKNTKDRKLFYKVAHEKDNINAFTIDDGTNKKIVLKYNEIVEDRNLASKIYKESNILFYKKNYKKALDGYLKIFSFFNKPNAYICASIAFCYYYIGDNDNAYQFFQLADMISKNTEKPYDFSGILNEISRTSELNRKETFDFEEDNFDFDVFDHFNIEIIYSLIEKASKENLSLDEYCNKLEIDEENKNIIMLMYSIICYTQASYKFGDKYLNIVIKNKNKSVLIKSLIEEISSKKNFYKNKNKLTLKRQ